MAKYLFDGELTHTPASEIEAALADPGFGKYFTDQLAQAVWTPDEGWHDHQLLPMGAQLRHPGMAALHYGQEIFEGLKAYRHADDSIWLFRPERNAARFADSARRMAMPPFPEQDFLAAVTELVAHNAAWVPQPTGEQSLYIRPFIFASETLIGVRDAHQYTFQVIATPVGPYYADPLALWITPDYSRSAHGGTGAVKCGGNYAASMAAEIQAHENGCGQVLWLDSATRTLVEEGGTMNFMCISADDELITPELSGTILPGITRDSLLRLGADLGLKITERALPLAELVDGIKAGQIVEALACGTAAVVCPVVGLKSPEFEVTIANGQPGEWTMRLRAELTGLQYGTRPDPYGWLHQVC